MAAEKKRKWTDEEERVYLKAFRESSGKSLRGRTGDAEDALKKHRGKKKKKGSKGKTKLQID